MDKELEKAARELFRPLPVIHIKPKVEKVEEQPMKLDNKVEKVATQYMKIQQQVLRVSSETKKLQHN